jgi:predicted nuclease with TOPRIM domain
MSVNQVYIVDDLKQKIRLLGEKLENQKKACSDLAAENIHLENKLREQTEAVNKLKNKHNTLMLSKAFVGENGESQEAKIQINKIVREIDRCIALLNR